MVGLLLLLGLFWYWASTLIGDDSDNGDDVTPTVAIVIDSTETATATATTETNIAPTETTNQPAGETPTEASGNQEEVTPTEEATEETTSASDTFEDGESVQTSEGGINFRSSPSTSDDNIIDTLDAGTELTITGPAVEGDDGNIWWPVNDPATDEDGYIVEQYLEASS